MKTMRSRLAERMWQEESSRAAGRPRLIAWEEENEDVRAHWLRHADAILEELREPDEAVLEEGVAAVHGEVNGRAVLYIWQAMIDHARQEVG